jgi:beta-glucosidase
MNSVTEPPRQQSVAIALKAGNDLNCGPEFANLENATTSGFVDESDLDVAVKRLLRRRVQVGDDSDLPVGV